MPKRRYRKKRKRFLSKVFAFCFLLTIGICCLFFLLKAGYFLYENGIKHHIQKTQYPTKYSTYVEKYAEEYELDPYLVYALIKQESKFDPYATSSANARGLMQILDETAEFCAKRIGIKITIPDDLYQPEINIQIGCYYLRHLLDLFDGDLKTAVTAYNGGPGNVEKWLQDDELADGNGGIANIPFGETENYVKNVLSYYETYKNIYQNK